MQTAKTVLCVDDEEPVLLMQKMLLESAGFHVLAARSGAQALLTFKSQQVDAVVMDYVMPETSGITTAQLMKQLKPDIPIVFLSAYAELPNETLGLAQWWTKKGEEPPESFVARLHSLFDDTGLEQRSIAS